MAIHFVVTVTLVSCCVVFMPAVIREPPRLGPERAATKKGPLRLAAGLLSSWSGLELTKSLLVVVLICASPFTLHLLTCSAEAGPDSTASLPLRFAAKIYWATRKHFKVLAIAEDLACG